MSFFTWWHSFLYLVLHSINLVILYTVALPWMFCVRWFSNERFAFRFPSKDHQWPIHLQKWSLLPNRYFIPFHSTFRSFNEIKSWFSMGHKSNCSQSLKGRAINKCGSHSWAWQGRNAYGKGNSYKFSTNAIRVDIVNETNQPQKEKETPQMIMIEMQTGARISNI